ncbi:MAG: hypothetical protein U1G07_09555 [Verrucomicrobiota bacterium]
MHLNPQFISLRLAWLVSLFAVGAALAEPAAVPLQITSQTRSAPDLGRTYQTVQVKRGDLHLAFIPPKQCGVTTNSANEITIAAPNSAFWIRLAFDRGSGPATKDDWRQRLKSHRPGCVIRSEMDRGVAQKNATIFDLEYQPTPAVALTQRVVLLTVKDTIIEISCSANRGAQEDAWRSFEQLLGTLRIAEDGKIELPALSGRL